MVGTSPTCHFYSFYGVSAHLTTEKNECVTRVNGIEYYGNDAKSTHQSKRARVMRNILKSCEQFVIRVD